MIDVQYSLGETTGIGKLAIGLTAPFLVETEASLPNDVLLYHVVAVTTINGLLSFNLEEGIVKT